MVIRNLSQAKIINRLMKKYKKPLGAKVGDSKQIAKIVCGRHKNTYIC